MTNKMSSTLFIAGLLAATLLFVPYAPSVAQERSSISTEFSAQQQQEKKNVGSAPRAAPQRAAPQRAAPQRAVQQRAVQQRAVPHVAAQRRVQSHVAAPQRTAPRIATPRRTPSRTVTQSKATTRVVRQPKTTTRVVRQPKTTTRAVRQPKTTTRVVRQPKTTPKVVGPAATGRKLVSPARAPRVVTPRGTRTVTAARLRGVPTRGVGRTVIRGHNYSAWRSGHRVRHGRGWRTFLALSALGAIAIGSNEYYPYAYISAPEPYCEGLTEDGCELMWQDVETEEGDVIEQCVAYCPWQ
jgi:hypothetical protein